MRITRSCLILRYFGTHTTPRVLYFSALVYKVRRQVIKNGKIVRLHPQLIIINPRRACARVIVVFLSVCVCVCVCACVCVCLFVKSHLASGVSVRPENTGVSVRAENPVKYSV